jgi:hypothetical protein
MRRFWLTDMRTNEEHEVRGCVRTGDDVVALACPWCAHPDPSCLVDLVHGTFWCFECERKGYFAYRTRMSQARGV